MMNEFTEQRHAKVTALSEWHCVHLVFIWLLQYKPRFLKLFCLNCIEKIAFLLPFKNCQEILCYEEFLPLLRLWNFKNSLHFWIHNMKPFFWITFQARILATVILVEASSPKLNPCFSLASSPPAPGSAGSGNPESTPGLRKCCPGSNLILNHDFFLTTAHS